jgi:hypothetical protein
VARGHAEQERSPPYHAGYRLLRGVVPMPNEVDAAARGEGRD